MAEKHWNIVADVGGTNARFGLADAESHQLRITRHYTVAEHSQFVDALGHFLADVAAAGEWTACPDSGCFALACPIVGDAMKFTNSPWMVVRDEVATALGGANVDLINDFAAVGHAIASLGPQDWVEIGGGTVDPHAPVAVLGAGTGLGVCSVVPVGARHHVIAGEGGHVDYAPVDAVEMGILQQLSAEFGRVSAERVLSGTGIENIHRALCSMRGQQPQARSAANISASAVAGSDPLATEVLEIFCRGLGSVAGNLALTLGARGGVYIAGGVVPRFIEFFRHSGFMSRFLAKGRFESYLREIPVRVVIKQDLGLAGAVNKLTLDI